MKKLKLFEALKLRNGALVKCFDGDRFCVGFKTESDKNLKIQLLTGEVVEISDSMYLVELFDYNELCNLADKISISMSMVRNIKYFEKR